MIPSSFEYKSANSVDEALGLLGEDAQILGGGHSLIPALKLRLNAPGTLVDISRINSLKKHWRQRKIGFCGCRSDACSIS